MRQLPASFVVLTALLSGSAQAAPAPQPAAWPTVQRQLAADRVAPGTALEKLIRENQDFSLLRAEELNDRRSRQVPLWLRVYWRKAHPDMQVYPLVLKEVHEWMVSHPDLPGVRGISSLQAAANDQTDKKKKPPKPTVSVNAGPDLRISPNEASTPRSESDIRINFWNTEQIVAASNNIEDHRRARPCTTPADGGASWGRPRCRWRPPTSFHSDPTVEWTSDGTAWATTLVDRRPARELTGTPTSPPTAAPPGPSPAPSPATRPRRTSR